MSEHHAKLQDNIFEWHFAIRGPPDTEFEVRQLAAPSCVSYNPLLLTCAAMYSDWYFCREAFTMGVLSCLQSTLSSLLPSS